MRHPQFSEELFQRLPIVGILRGYSKDICMTLINIYQELGFTNIEITMNTAGVGEIISEARARHGESLNVGAGTVCNLEDLDRALNVGAQFIVCPITDLDVIQKCKHLDVPVFPGALTPTEIYKASQAGARMVKVFPASKFGPQYLKEVLAPLNQIELMPTGGVNLENMGAYQKAGAKAYGMGSSLFNKAIIQEEKWDLLRQHLSEIKSKVEQIQSSKNL